MIDFSVERVDWSTHCEILCTIRYEVFVVGQNVPVELERDDQDPSCIHFLARESEGTPIGTARVDQEGHIGRVAVLKSNRGQGVGTRLMQFAIDCLRDQGLEFALLNSQSSAADFYFKLGFEKRGEEFMEAGIPHIAMRKPLRDETRHA